MPGSVRYGVRATRAVGTLVPPGRPNLIAGVATHLGLSLAFGQVPGRVLPRRHSALWGTAYGAAMGLVGAGIVGRRFNAVRELPIGPQLADNMAFGRILPWSRIAGTDHE